MNRVLVSVAAAIAVASCGGQSSQLERKATTAEGGTNGGSGSGGVNGVLCMDQDAIGIGGDPRGYGTRGTTNGRNGTFVDACDENGNLIEHHCYFDRCFVDDCGDNHDALTEVVECPTGCQDGACLTWCPGEGPLFVAFSDGGVLLLENGSGQWLRCTVDWSADGYDCSSPSLIGTRPVADVSSVCEPTFRMRLDDLDVGGMHECELLCHALPQGDAPPPEI